MMTAVAVNEVKKQSRAQKWGWGTLLTVSALLVLNGVAWYFIGPTNSQSYLEQIGVPMEQFSQSYPEAVVHLARNTHQVAIWYVAFGLMALMVALEGFRHRSRWAWNATWVVVSAPIAIGLVYTIGAGFGLAFDNVGMFLFAAVALVGQLLARSGLVESK